MYHHGQLIYIDFFCGTTSKQTRIISESSASSYKYEITASYFKAF